MTFCFAAADQPPVWMRFVAEQEGAVRAVCAERASETLGTDIEQPREKIAGVHISSVDRVSLLAKCGYQLGVLIVRLFRAVFAARHINRVARKLRLPNVGRLSDPTKLTTTTGRCRDAVVVETSLSAGPLGSRNDRCLPRHRGIARLLRSKLGDRSKMKMSREAVSNCRIDQPCCRLASVLLRRCVC